MIVRLERIFARYFEWYARIVVTNKLYIEHCGGRRLPLFRPRTFSEKMQWRKLFGGRPIYARFCDKLDTRKYIAEHGFGQRLTPLLWQGDRPEDIPFATLPLPYILKSSHGSGQYKIVIDGTVDREQVKAEAAGWLATNYGDLTGETGYRRVPPKLLVEQLLQNADGTSPTEYCFFLFDGVVRFIEPYSYDGARNRRIRFLTREWTALDWRIDSPLIDPPPLPPADLSDMIDIAETLGRDLDHVRIDFLQRDGTFYLGEITLYSYSGHVEFRQKGADLALGRHWIIRRPLMRAAWSILTRRWGELL